MFVRSPSIPPLTFPSAAHYPPQSPVLRKILDKLFRPSAQTGPLDLVPPNDVVTLDLGRRRRGGKRESGPSPGPLDPTPSAASSGSGGEGLSEQDIGLAETDRHERAFVDGASSGPPADEMGDPEEPITQDPFLAEIAQVAPEGRAPLPDLVDHQLIGGGRYRIVRRLGKGGMGAVYEAEDLRLGRAVALKVLLNEGGSEEWRRRFAREARAVAVVSHPNVAALYDADEDGGRCFIVMELLLGRSLRAVLAEGPLPVERVIRIARQIVLGLGAAHEKGIVHRDIKPDNIMISDGDGVKILDFGIAKIVAGSLHEERSHGRLLTTKTGQVMGTPHYMSPEQARGAVVDPRTDIFSFGVVLYEMLAGRRPFRGKTQLEVILDVVNRVPEPVSSHRPGAPGEVEAIIERCLQKEAEDRFQSAGELLSALDGERPFLARATPVPSTRVAVAGVGRMSRTWLAAAAIVGGVAGVAFFWGGSWRNSTGGQAGSAESASAPPATVPTASATTTDGVGTSTPSALPTATPTVSPSAVATSIPTSSSTGTAVPNITQQPPNVGTGKPVTTRPTASPGSTGTAKPGSVGSTSPPVVPPENSHKPQVVNFDMPAPPEDPNK